MKRFYQVYGAVILLFLTSATLLGWSFGPKRRVRDVPRSLRDNPGVWRSHYYGGK